MSCPRAAFEVLSNRVQREQYDTLIKYGVTTSTDTWSGELPSTQFQSSSSVTVATQDGWMDGLNALVASATKPLLVHFFSDEDQGCKAFAKDFLATADHLKTGAIADVAVVNIAWAPDLANTHGVISVPAFRLFLPGEKNPSIYRGPLTREALASFTLADSESEARQGSDFVSILSSAQEIRRFVAKEKPTQLSAIYFHTEAHSYTAGFLSAAGRFKGAVRFASLRVDHLKPSYREEYGIDPEGRSLPTIRVWSGSSQSPDGYTGAMEDGGVSRFLTNAAEKCSPERRAAQAQKRPGATEVTELEAHGVRDACPIAAECKGKSPEECPQEEGCLILITFSPSFNAMATHHIEKFKKVAIAVNGDASPKVEGGLPRFFWVDSMRQPRFLASLSVEMGHLPKVIAYRQSGEHLSAMQGDNMDPDALEEFARKAQAGKCPWQPAPRGLLGSIMA